MVDLMSLRMLDMLVGALVTLIILGGVRFLERRWGTVFIRGSIAPEDKLLTMEAKIQELTAKIQALETQADYLIETILECRAALEKEQSVRRYLSERVSTLQGYPAWRPDESAPDAE